MNKAFTGHLQTFGLLSELLSSSLKISSYYPSNYWQACMQKPWPSSPMLPHICHKCSKLKLKWF